VAVHADVFETSACARRFKEVWKSMLQFSILLLWLMSQFVCAVQMTEILAEIVDCWCPALSQF
jgi:hypothetical protein